MPMTTFKLALELTEPQPLPSQKNVGEAILYMILLFVVGSNGLFRRYTT